MHALSRHLPHFGPVTHHSLETAKQEGAKLEAAKPDAAKRLFNPAPRSEKPSHVAAEAKPEPLPALLQRKREEAPRLFTADDLARAAADARRVALEEGAAALAACEQSRADAAAKSMEQIADARQHWCTEEADRLAEAFRTGLCALETHISESLTPVLAAFVTSQIRERAVTDLCGLMSARLAQENAAILKVSGPADLLEALRERLQDAAGIEFLPGEQTEVRVVVDDTIMETQFAAWAERLALPSA